MSNGFDGSIDPGMLRHYIDLQRNQVTALQPGGQPLANWTTIHSDWGFVNALQGRELVQAQQIKSTITHEIIVRNRCGFGGLNITSKDRFVFGTVILNIEAVLEVDGFDEAYRIMATRLA